MSGNEAGHFFVVDIIRAMHIMVMRMKNVLQDLHAVQPAKRVYPDLRLFAQEDTGWVRQSTLRARLNPYGLGLTDVMAAGAGWRVRTGYGRGGVVAGSAVGRLGWVPSNWRVGLPVRWRWPGSRL